MTNILAAETDDPDDKFTHWAYEYRSQEVYPRLRGCTVEEMTREDVTRQKIDGKLQEGNHDVLIVVGHGFSHAIQGFDRDWLFRVDSPEDEHVAGKILHFVSCDTATLLGPHLTETHHARAFFGYADTFVFHDIERTRSSSAHFYDCDAEVDRAIGSGESLDRVRAAVEAKFRSVMERLNSKEEVEENGWGGLFETCPLEDNLEAFRAYPMDNAPAGGPHV